MYNYIKNCDIILKIICEKEIILQLKKELLDYYEFITGDFQEDFTIYIYIDKVKYKKVSTENFVKNRGFNEKIYKDRDGLVIVNKDKKEIIAFYEYIDNNVIQFIEEIIISIFGVFLAKSKFFFMHAACVEKNGKAIAIIGDRSSGKTTLMNILLQNGFNFVCNSHLGIKDKEEGIQALGTPSRMGMRVETIEKAIKPIFREKIFYNTEFRKRFGNEAEKNLSFYKKKKFNIKVNEIKEIYNISLIPSSTLKLILIPMYLEPIEHLKINKIQGFDKKEILLKNKREEIYDTTRYMKILSLNEKVDLPNNLNKIDIYKVYQNERNTKELIEFISSKINI